MRFTIIADQLPKLSVKEFKHEFLWLYLPSAIDGATQLTGLPLPEHKRLYQSLAQLTWPSVEVLQGSPQSVEYRVSAAAKHEFAAPKHLFLTERLETDQGKRYLNVLGGLGNYLDVDNKQRPVMLIAALTPKAGIDNAEFDKLWTKHANGVRTTVNGVRNTAKMVYDWRNAVIPVSSEHVRAVVAGTQFPAKRC